MRVLEKELKKTEAIFGARFLQAYLEASDEIQRGVRQLLTVLNDPTTDADDAEMTLHTLADALFPQDVESLPGHDLQKLTDSELHHEEAKLDAQFDQQEALFAEKLGQAMRRQGLSQEELAQRVGIGQPAVSNMLNRRCRPQRATVERFAKALGVTPNELWPGF